MFLCSSTLKIVQRIQRIQAELWLPWQPKEKLKISSFRKPEELELKYLA
jgi:hypothetical protein